MSIIFIMVSASVAARMAYFFFFAAGASLLPHLTLFYRSAGLPGRLVGILAAVAPAASLVGAWVWGGLADKSGSHRAILWVAVLAAIVLSQLFAPGISFPYLLVVASLFAFFASPMIPLIDNSVMDLVKQTGGRYGSIRLWGAAGWGIAAPATGLMIGSLGLRSAFPAYGAIMILFALASTRLPIHSAPRVPNFWIRIRPMLRNPRWIFFILAVFARGVGGAFVHHYLMIYMADLGASATLRGVALSVATASELAGFLLADRLIRRFGAERVILLAIAATSLRLFLYSVIANPGLILAVQLLHGVTFATFLVAGVTLARDLAPSGLEATSQAIFSGVTFGAAGIVGGYLGGELLDRVGVHGMYRVASVATLVGLGTFIGFRLMNRRWKTEAKT